MPTLIHEIKYLIWVVEELKVYLLSDHLYWPSGVRLSSTNSLLNQITPGNILWANKTLEIKSSAGCLSSADNMAYQAVYGKINSIWQEWRTAWEKKINKDLTARMRPWLVKIDEMDKMGGDLSGYYRTAVRDRVIIALLVKSLSGDDLSITEQINMYDNLLRERTQKHSFIWDQELISGYDKNEYWFLYCLPS